MEKYDIFVPNLLFYFPRNWIWNSKPIEYLNTFHKLKTVKAILAKKHIIDRLYYNKKYFSETVINQLHENHFFLTKTSNRHPRIVNHSNTTPQALNIYPFEPYYKFIQLFSRHGPNHKGDLRKKNLEQHWSI